MLVAEDAGDRDAGQEPAAPAGAHTTPGTSPTQNSRSVTPSEVVSVSNRIAAASLVVRRRLQPPAITPPPQPHIRVPAAVTSRL